MKRFAMLGALFAASISTASAQTDAQMTWQGEVSGPAMLRIQGDRIDFDSRYVRTQDYRFYSPLPQQRANVTVQVLQGRGDVRVVEQPTRRNNFTAVVSVNPRRQREVFSLQLGWDAPGQSGSVFGNDPYSRNNEGYRSRTRDAYNSGTISWAGRVDQEGIIEFRNGRALERTLRGQPVVTHDVNFSSRVPRADVQMQLVDVRGRGRVEIVEHPNSANRYIARVRVSDPDNGAGDYAFTLAWGDNYGQTGSYGSYGENDRYRTTDSVFGNSGSSGSVGEGGMTFSARVDGRIRVIAQGGQYWIQTLSGRQPVDVRVNFNSPIPNQPVNVEIDREHGRDEVRLIERPTASNGYRLVFEIDDESGGADFYEVQAKW